MIVGATKPELNVEIWSGTHPFYTGQQRLLDTEGQVDRFMTRLKKREEMLKAQEESAQKELPTNLAIDSIGLATRAQNALTEAGLSTVGDLLTYLEEGDDALLAIPGVGRKALIDVKRYLRAEGLIE
jgi:large subunit ribosomal protein L31